MNLSRQCSDVRDFCFMCNMWVGVQLNFYLLYFMTYIKSATKTIDQCATQRSINVSTQYVRSLKTRIRAKGKSRTIVAPIIIIPFSNMLIWYSSYSCFLMSEKTTTASAKIIYAYPIYLRLPCFKKSDQPFQKLLFSVLPLLNNLLNSKFRVHSWSNLKIKAILTELSWEHKIVG